MKVEKLQGRLINFKRSVTTSVVTYNPEFIKKMREIVKSYMFLFYSKGTEYSEEDRPANTSIVMMILRSIKWLQFT